MSIALSQLGKIELLSLLYDKIYVPQAVYEEVSVRGSGRPGSTELKELVGKPYVEIKSPRDWLAVESLHDPLGLGESEAILLASELGCIVALDDKMARNKAKSLGLKVVGTIGILRKAYDRGLLEKEELIDSIRRLKETGFRIPDKIIELLDKKLPG